MVRIFVLTMALLVSGCTTQTRSVRSKVVLEVQHAAPEELEARLGILLHSNVQVRAVREPKAAVTVLATPELQARAQELVTQFDRPREDTGEVKGLLGTVNVPCLVVLRALSQKYPNVTFIPMRRHPDKFFVRVSSRGELARIAAELERLDQLPKLAQVLATDEPEQIMELEILYAPKKPLAEHYFHRLYPRAKVESDYQKGTFTIRGLPRVQAQAYADQILELDRLALELAEKP